MAVAYVSGSSKNTAARHVAGLQKNVTHSPTALAAGHGRGLADRVLATGFLPTAGLAWLLVILVSAQFALHPTSLDQLLEATQRRANRFPIVNTHPQTHKHSNLMNSSCEFG
jgi:hypothetical protein